MVRLPYTTALTTLFSYGLLFAFGQLRDFFRKLVDWFKAKNVKVRGRPGAPARPRRPNSTSPRPDPGDSVAILAGPSLDGSLIRRLASCRGTRRSVWAWRISTCAACTFGSR
jgi:hypothetical protein